MRDRDTDRRRAPGSASSPRREPPHPVLALQRAAGNHAVAQMLARAAHGHGHAPATGGNSVQIPGLGNIKVTSGNLEEWTGAETPQTVDITSHKGKHSAKLEHLSEARTTIEAKVNIAPANNAGEQLSVGGGTVLEIKGAIVEHYDASGGAETWRLGGSMSVHRIKTVHHVA
jgi:hypothetical protein